MKSSSHSRRKPALVLTLLCGVLLGLSACNDTNTPISAATPAAPTPTAPTPITPTTPTPAKAARVEIVQTGLLFTTSGQTRQLSARVFDAAGAAVDVPVRWLSSDPANISVASNGMASAERASGSTQITATVDEVRSTPLLAVVTTVASGTVLVSDEQIVRGAVETDPAAAPSLENTYTVVVNGVPTPAVGTLMAGTGSQPLAGRVVSTRAVEGGVEITLKLAPLPELFPGLNINQTFDLSRAEVTIQPEIAAMYTVTRDGDSYQFTPRAGAAARAKAGGAVGGFAFNRECDVSITGAGLGEGAAPPVVFEPFPNMTFTLSPALDVLYTESRGLERFVVTAEPRFVIAAGFTATAAFQGKIECTAELMRFRIPVGGALSFLISGIVPVGLGIELGGEVTLAQLKVGFTSSTQASAEAGLVCEGPCRFIGNLSDFVTTNTPKVELPGTEDFRVAPDFTAFGFIELAVGNPLFASLTFEALEVKGGLKLEGKFAPPSVQIEATNFMSQYQLSLQATAGLGDDIEKVLNILGVVDVGNDVFQTNAVIAASPAGTLTANQSRFQPGDTVKFELALDAGSPAQAGPPAVDAKPDTTAFLGLYNVKDIVLIRKKSNGQSEVARVAASPGQKQFSFTFIAPDEGEVKEFTAFAVTRLLPVELLALELGTASGSNAAPVAQADSSTTIVNSDAIPIAVLANDRDANGDTLRVSAATGGSEGGQVTINAAQDGVLYRPATDFVGIDTFQYTVVDDKGGSDQGTVQVQVFAQGVARLFTTSNVTRVSVASCRNTKDDCLIDSVRTNDQRENTTTGFSSNLESPATNTSISGAVRSKAEGNATVALDRTDGTAHIITLRCDDQSEFSAPPVEGQRNISSASASSNVRVVFDVESVNGLVYEIRGVGGMATAPGAPTMAAASANGSLFTPSGSAFSASSSTSGTQQSGSPAGQLRPGRHTLSLSCNTSGTEGRFSANMGGGVSTSGMGLQLILGR